MTTFATDLEQATRLHNAPPLQPADFEGGLLFRDRDFSYARPAQYQERVPFRVCGEGFGYKTKNVTCHFGDVVVHNQENGTLVPSEVISGADYNNRFTETGRRVDDCQQAFQLYKVIFCKDDHTIMFGSMPFLIVRGSYVAMAVRKNGDHKMRPLEILSTGANGRAKIPDHMVACREDGAPLVCRMAENLRGGQQR